MHPGVMYMLMRQVAWVCPKLLPRNSSYICFLGSLRLIAPACNRVEISPKSLPIAEEVISIYLQKHSLSEIHAKMRQSWFFARLCISISRFCLHAFALLCYQEIRLHTDTDLVSTFRLHMASKITEVREISGHFCQQQRFPKLAGGNGSSFLPQPSMVTDVKKSQLRP
jgi:hypothetical protein